MGEDKLLMAWGDSTVIESLLASWRASRVDEIVVVTRADQAELHSLCRNASIVTPDTPPPEMKDSVLAALNYISDACAPRETDAWLLAPADMPHLATYVIDALTAAHDPGSPEIIVPICDEKRGHPVLFPWSLAQAVNELEADEGVNALLERFPVRELVCDVGDIHGDLDTPADYARLRSQSDPHAGSPRRRDD